MCDAKERYYIHTYFNTLTFYSFIRKIDVVIVFLFNVASIFRSLATYGSVVLNFVEEIGVLQKCDCVVVLTNEGCFWLFYVATLSDVLKFSAFV